MKFSVLAVCMSAILISGCATTAQTRPTQVAIDHSADIRFEKLKKSCYSKNNLKRLESADRVMELIVRGIRVQQEDTHLYTAGSKLYKLTGKFYRNSIDTAQCVKSVEEIKDEYDLSYQQS